MGRPAHLIHPGERLRLFACNSFATRIKIFYFSILKT